MGVEMSDLIAVLPAAGRGSRLGSTPSSKEILPLGFDHSGADHDGLGQWRPVTAIESHLWALRSAGVVRVIVVVGHGKHDIMDYLGSGSRYGVKISYLFQDELRGMPFALDLAHAWTAESTTLFAMPDTLIEPADTARRLSRAHLASGADLSLGLFETDNPRKFGMVRTDADGRIVELIDKPRFSHLRLMWGLAAWSPTFADFMHDYLKGIVPTAAETLLTDVFAEALRSGLTVNAVPLTDARYNDIGTPSEFQSVVRRLANRQQPVSANGSALTNDADPVRSTVVWPRLSVVRAAR